MLSSQFREFFAGHLSDRIKYFVSQNEILLVLTNRLQGFVKTDRQQFILSYILKMNYFLIKTIQIQNKAAFHLTQLLSS